MVDDATDGALHIACLTHFDHPGLEAEWAALHERLGAMPFSGPAWAVSWWHSLRRDAALTRDSLRLFVVRDERGALVAVAPMMLTERRLAGVSVARTLHFIGADPNITEVRGMLVAPEDEARTVAALYADIEKRREHDRLIWSGLSNAGGAPLASGAPGASHALTVSVLIVALPQSWDIFKSALPRNTREALRKCYNSLGRESLTPSLRVHDTLETISPTLDHFFALHASRAAVEDGVAHRDCFDTVEARDFLRALVTRLAPSGIVRMFALEVDGSVVAMRLAFLYGGGIYLYYAGYDPTWGKFSVMTTLVAEVLKHAIELGLPFANLSTGVDRSKMRWRPAETQFESILVISTTPRARMAIRFEALTQRTRFLRDRFARGRA
jgi:CelD/BcsL family acetyltransferase involved in cellulose biosynthesis